MVTDTLHTNRQRIGKIKSTLLAARTTTTNNDFRRLSPFVQHEMESLQQLLNQAESSLEALNEFLDVRDALDTEE